MSENYQRRVVFYMQYCVIYSLHFYVNVYLRLARKTFNLDVKSIQFDLYISFLINYTEKY